MEFTVKTGVQKMEIFLQLLIDISENILQMQNAYS